MCIYDKTSRDNEPRSKNLKTRKSRKNMKNISKIEREYKTFEQKI